MQLVLNNRGSFIGKRGEYFYIKKGDEKHEIPACSIDSILIAESTTITTDAVKLALEYNVEIILINTNGEPIGKFWHAKFGSTAEIRRRQMIAYLKPIGLEIVKELVTTKIRNQREFLKELRKSRPTKEFIQENIEKIESRISIIKSLQGTIETNRQKILGEEGYSSKCYFETLGKLVQKKFSFTGRSRRPATDPFNCYLNYGYGILYSRITSAIILAGLDPFLGFLHTDRYNKPSLVFDVIEAFRIIVDKRVFYLFSRRKVSDGHFDKIEGGIHLNEEGRRIIIEQLNDELEKTVQFNKRQVTQKEKMMSFCHKLANRLLEEPGLIL